jgi:hypothetical protein
MVSMIEVDGPPANANRHHGGGIIGEPVLLNASKIPAMFGSGSLPESGGFGDHRPGWRLWNHPSRELLRDLAADFS